MNTHIQGVFFVEVALKFGIQLQSLQSICVDDIICTCVVVNSVPLTIEWNFTHQS